MTREHMLDDQRFASSRPTSSPTRPTLEEDFTIAGPIAANMKVSTSGTDCDWVVKLIDVYPGDYPNPDPNPAGVEMGGYQQLVRGEAMRGQVPQQLRRARAVRAGEGDACRLCPCRTSVTLSAGASHHGAGAKLVVPAD